MEMSDEAWKVAHDVNLAHERITALAGAVEALTAAVEILSKEVRAARERESAGEVAPVRTVTVPQC